MVSIVWRPSGPALRAARHVGGACGLGPRVGGGGSVGPRARHPESEGRGARRPEEPRACCDSPHLISRAAAQARGRFCPTEKQINKKDIADYRAEGRRPMSESPVILKAGLAGASGAA